MWAGLKRNRITVAKDHLAWRSPDVGLGVESDVHKQVAQLDAGPKQPPHLEHAVTVAQPPQHGDLVRDFLPAVCHTDAHESGMRLSGDKMDGVAEDCVHPVALGRHVLLTLDAWRQWQHVAHCAEACGVAQLT
eukprot:5044597-Prymnesium_polylepis.1